MSQPIHELRAGLRSLERVLVCFSGGVDSSYLLAEAVNVLGHENVVAFTAVSPSLAPEEAALASRIASQLGAQHRMVATHELDDARYAANPFDRCYFCKTEVYGVALREAVEHGVEHVIDGFNVDDRSDHRPGRRAARELGVRSPLAEHGLGKAQIRAAAHAIGLSVWDKPALACLASRLPYGTLITPELLSRVARAERAVRAFGYRVVRVRSFDARARVELGAMEFEGLDQPRREAICAAIRDVGFELVDFAPYVQGALNQPQMRAGLKPTQ